MSINKDIITGKSISLDGNILSTGGATIPLFQVISLYSPIITLISIFLFSIFSSAIGKGLFYIASVFFVTAIRIAFIYIFFPDNDKSFINSNPICENGKLLPYTSKTYSTFFLAFTAFYLVVPMFILSSINKTNMVNYLVLLFFIAYIIFDGWIKYSLNCILFNSALLGDFLVGGLFGSLIALILFYSDKISLMFINELNSNKEVCSVPSKQQFRCSIFKDGMIVGSSITA
jgi:hypothetical protein